MRIAICTDIYLPQLSGVADSILLAKEELEKRGHEVLVYGPAQARSFSMPGWDGSMMLALPFGMVKKLREFKPDIIHVHTFAPIGLVAIYAGWRLGVPVVGTNHTFPADYLRFFGLDYAPLRYFLRRTNAWFYNRCVYLMAPSQKIIAEMREYHCERPAVVLSNPIPLNLFRPLANRQSLKAKYNLGDKVVLLFGRLGPDKNLDFALDVFVDVHRQTGAQLLVVGDGPSRMGLEARVEELGLKPFVRFAGMLRGEPLVEAINTAEVYLITSVESQSMTNLQAMAAGLPAVGPNIGGLPEYLKDGESGYLAPLTDQAAFVRAVVDLLSDREKRLRFGQAARASIAPFSLEVIVDKVEKIYKSQIYHSSKVSLIIPAHNEEKYIGRCLEHVIKNASGPYFEIIVIDNASTDRTNEIASQFPGVRVVREERKGLTVARQRGFMEAKGDLLAYVDSDTLPSDGWQAMFLREFSRNPELVCLSGPYIYHDLPQHQQYFVRLFYLLALPVYWVVGYLATGGNFVIKRKTLEKMSGFDTSIKFYGEDTDLARRASAFGKVKFKLGFAMPSSARRLAHQGVLKTTWIYIMNYISEVAWHRPSTGEYSDIR